MPRFLINYLKRTIHQKDSNEVIRDNEGANGFEFSLDVIKRLDIKVTVEGLENPQYESSYTGGAVTNAINSTNGEVFGGFEEGAVATTTTTTDDAEYVDVAPTQEQVTPPPARKKKKKKNASQKRLPSHGAVDAYQEEEAV